MRCPDSRYLRRYRDRHGIRICCVRTHSMAINHVAGEAGEDWRRKEPFPDGASTRPSLFRKARFPCQATPAPPPAPPTVRPWKNLGTLWTCPDAVWWYHAKGASPSAVALGACKAWIVRRLRTLAGAACCRCRCRCPMSLSPHRHCKHRPKVLVIKPGREVWLGLSGGVLVVCLVCLVCLMELVAACCNWRVLGVCLSAPQVRRLTTTLATSFPCPVRILSSERALLLATDGKANQHACLDAFILS